MQRVQKGCTTGKDEHQEVNRIKRGSPDISKGFLFYRRLNDKINN